MNYNVLEDGTVIRGEFANPNPFKISNNLIKYTKKSIEIIIEENGKHNIEDCLLISESENEKEPLNLILSFEGKTYSALYNPHEEGLIEEKEKFPSKINDYLFRQAIDKIIQNHSKSELFPEFLMQYQSK